MDKKKIDDSSRKNCRKRRRRILRTLGITFRIHELGDFWLGSPVLGPHPPGLKALVSGRHTRLYLYIL